MKLPIALLAWIFALSGLHAQIDARLFQYPDVSESHIAFTYGGDIWLVPKEGVQLPSSPPQKERKAFHAFLLMVRPCFLWQL